MERQPHKDLLDRTFQIGIALKGVDGLLEVAGGLALVLVSPSTINRIAFALTRQELSEDSHDFIATHILGTARGITTGSVLFAAIYLLSHGGAKVALVVALFAGRMWAYPWMIAFLLAFMIYQLYRIAVSPGIGMVLLTIFDGVIVLLTWREYRKQRALARPP